MCQWFQTHGQFAAWELVESMETAERVTTKWVEISPERRKDLESLGYDRNSWDNKVMPSSPSKTKLQGLSTSKHHDFEFGGPINVIFMMVGLPVGVWGLYLACNERSEGCPRLEVRVGDTLSTASAS